MVNKIYGTVTYKLKKKKQIHPLLFNVKITKKKRFSIIKWDKIVKAIVKQTLLSFEFNYNI